MGWSYADRQSKSHQKPQPSARRAGRFIGYNQFLSENRYVVDFAQVLSTALIGKGALLAHQSDGGRGMGLLKLNAAWIALVAMILSIAIACGTSLENQIVFVSTIDGDEEIYLLDPDNGDIFPLTNNTSKDFNPKLSPDGNHVVYLANESGQSEINLVDIKEEAITRLTHNVGDDQYPQWSPGGERIAYTSLQDDNPEVYLMSAEGGQGTRVTSNTSDDRVGDWSPDGEWLVFFRAANDPEKGLWLRNPDGVNLVQLTSESDSQPDWSPDGKHIAFVRVDGQSTDIYIVTKLKNGTWQDETELTRLTQHPEADLSPAWSPDSKNIAFVSFRDGNGEIYIMKDDGSSQRRLTSNGADDLSPVWSPDGKRMAFVSYIYGPGEIIIMAADGGDQLRMTNNDAEDHSPDW